MSFHQVPLELKNHIRIVPTRVNAHLARRCEVNPGNANLPIGVVHDAIQKNGVPGQLNGATLQEVWIEETESFIQADRADAASSR